MRTLLFLLMTLPVFAQDFIDNDRWSLRCPAGWKKKHTYATRVFSDQKYHEWTFAASLITTPLPSKDNLVLSYEQVVPARLLGRKGFAGSLTAQLPNGASWASYNYFVPTLDARWHYVVGLTVKPAQDMGEARTEFQALLSQLKLKR